jgi:choline dehydrogenase-like flavoprotein
MILESMVERGLDLDHDMFSHGENPHGCGHAPRTVHDGVRRTGADFVVNENKRNNLHLMVEAHVDKVLLEKGSDGVPKATGVRVMKADGSKVDIGASREVVVSGGSYCSPNILNRSGIGAKEELEKFGITLIVDLPGVGKNLMDHLVGIPPKETVHKTPI